MKETMRAAVLRGYHEPLQIEEKPIPVPGPGEVLVKVRASGLCVSDIHIQDGKIGTVHLPYTPGHEMAGVIVAVGKGASISPPPLISSAASASSAAPGAQTCAAAWSVSALSGTAPTRNTASSRQKTPLQWTTQSRLRRLPASRMQWAVCTTV